MDRIKLKNGVEMPLLGYGVLQMKNQEECEYCVGEALKAGYRLFDTAASYGNEEAVGNALRKAMKEGHIKREEVFVTTKLWISDTKEEFAKRAYEASCARLGLDYVDLYLIHQPYNDYYGAWRVLERLYQKGAVRAIGVSNFSPERLTDLCLNSEIPPMVNQVEMHPFYHQERAIYTMRELEVQPQAWAPLCEGMKNIFSNKVLERIGKKYGKSAAQTALRWNIDRQVSVVTRSRHPEHIREDFDIWDFRLSEADRKGIEPLDLGYSEILDYRNPCIARMFIQKKQQIDREKSFRDDKTSRYILENLLFLQLEWESFYNKYR